MSKNDAHNLVGRRRSPERRDRTGHQTRPVILYSVQCCYALH